MARNPRITLPVQTKLGLIVSYSELETHLADAEVRGRVWLVERAHDASRAGKVPGDFDILDLHSAMFGLVFEWAGKTRIEDVGPGWKVPVHWTDVAAQLRNLGLDAAVRRPGDSADLADVAKFIAWFHHRFQFLHPFQDTNGRTGRVLDHYLLWVSFSLVGADLAHSPQIEYFPSPAHENAYYEGLDEADSGAIEKLEAFYVERVSAAFSEPGG
ncbi:MAG: Fic family protein [Deltaproteobacteria bacterium]|nr:Fic family protein [Deltaproteobacteria bacterium]